MQRCSWLTINRPLHYTYNQIMWPKHLLLIDGLKPSVYNALWSDGGHAWDLHTFLILCFSKTKYEKNSKPKQRHHKPTKTLHDSDHKARGKRSTHTYVLTFHLYTISKDTRIKLLQYGHQLNQAKVQPYEKMSNNRVYNYFKKTKWRSEQWCLLV